MGKRGAYKYQCDDCSNTQMIHWVELNRASRPHCEACGSQRLEPYSRGAVKNVEIGDLNVREHNEDHRTDVSGTGKRTKKVSN